MVKKKIWILWSNYDHAIVSIHNLKREVIEHQRLHNKLRAGSVGVTPKQYEDSIGIISEVYPMLYQKDMERYVRHYPKPKIGDGE